MPRNWFSSFQADYYDSINMLLCTLKVVWPLPYQLQHRRWSYTSPQYPPSLVDIITVIQAEKLEGQSQHTVNYKRDQMVKGTAQPGKGVVWGERTHLQKLIKLQTTKHLIQVKQLTKGAYIQIQPHIIYVTGFAITCHLRTQWQRMFFITNRYLYQ